jgi:FAD binding domain
MGRLLRWALTRRDFMARTTSWSVGTTLCATGQALPAAVAAFAQNSTTGSTEVRPMPASVSWSTLEDRVHGRLLLPSSPAYDTARRIWNGAIDRRPAAILVCSRAADVTEGVRFAAASGLKVCVRGGGHNVAGRSVQDNALLIDLSAMRDVLVDAQARQVEAAGGATLYELDRATGLFGLATTGGLISHTGIGGLTLGGGIGWLMRRYGLTIDNLVSAQVVLASGKVVEASTTSNPELFWALRGGGGHVGVVTRFTYRLHPVSTVLAGPLWYRAERAPQVLRAVRELNAAAPDELTTVTTATFAPPDPALPQQLRGQPALVVTACWCGDLKAGEKVLAPLRGAQRADVDMIGPVPYPALQSSLDPTAPRGMQNWWESRYLKGLEDAALDWFAAQALTLPTPLSMIHMHQLGGAVSRGDRTDAAVDLRRNAYVINAIGASDKPADLNKMSDWARRCANGFGSTQTQAYVNFSSANQAFSEAAFADDVRRRLATIKGQYDPGALFT